mmetsp:Transcript_22804/g.44916  ORF Transcript_22804/g.44916 Transcript_22804/m.44916 type:complete len:83 (-) Transcript_22804:108-356(-)
MASTKSIGVVLLLLSVSIFVYYTLWVVVVPLLDEDNPLQGYFLERTYAIRLPVTAGVLLFVALLIVVGQMMVMEARRRQKNR